MSKHLTLAVMTAALTKFWDNVKSYVDTAISNVTGGLFNGDKVSADKLPVATATAKGIASFGAGLSVANGAVTAVTATATVKGIAAFGSGLSVSNGTVTVPTATASAKGIASFGSGLKVANGAVTVDFKAANDYTDGKIADLIGGAPETYDTLKEIADYISDHASVETALNDAIGKKANSADVYTKTEADSQFVAADDLATEAEVLAAVDAIFAA